MKTRLIIIAVVAVVLLGASGAVIGTQLAKNRPAAAPAPPPPPTTEPAPTTTPPAPPTRASTGCATTPNASGGILTEAPVTRWEAIGPAQRPITSGGPLIHENGIHQCFTPDSTGALTAAAYHMLYKGQPFTKEQRVAFAQLSNEGEERKTSEADALREPIVPVQILGFRFVEPIHDNTTCIYMHLQHPREPNKTLTLWGRFRWNGRTWVGTDPRPGDPSGLDKERPVHWEAHP